MIIPHLPFLRPLRDRAACIEPCHLSLHPAVHKTIRRPFRQRMDLIKPVIGHIHGDRPRRQRDGIGQNGRCHRIVRPEIETYHLRIDLELLRRLGKKHIDICEHELPHQPDEVPDHLQRGEAKDIVETALLLIRHQKQRIRQPCRHQRRDHAVYDKFRLRMSRERHPEGEQHHREASHVNHRRTYDPFIIPYYLFSHSDHLSSPKPKPYISIGDL